jgi:hypothetical protein
MLAREGMEAICSMEVGRETGRYFCPILARGGWRQSVGWKWGGRQVDISADVG